jgi:hypothetical protein
VICGFGFGNLQNFLFELAWLFCGGFEVEVNVNCATKVSEEEFSALVIICRRRELL